MAKLSRIFSASICALALAACSAPMDGAETAFLPMSEGGAETMAAPLSNDEERALRHASMQEMLAKARATQGAGSPAYWRYGDADTEIILFGSTHLLPPEMQWQSPALMEALYSADTLILESDVATVEGATAQMNAANRHGMFLRDESLSGTLTDSQEAALAPLLEELGLPFSVIDPMKPWFALVNISTLHAIREGFDPMSGVEMVLVKAIETRDVEMEFLETADDVFSLLASVPMEQQIETLLMSAEDIQYSSEMLNQLIEEWADGDVEGLTSLLIDDETQESELMYERLIVDRNANWIPALVALLDEPGTKFVAVGAAHLVGPDSVVKMLGDEGIEVTRGDLG